MELADQEPMRIRWGEAGHRSPFSTPEGTPALRRAVLGGLALALLALQPSGEVESAAAPGFAASGAPAVAAPVARDAAAPAAPPDVVQALRGDWRAVNQCVADGATSYSDQPCPPGARAQQVLVDPNQNLADGLLRSRIASSAPPGDRADRHDAAGWAGPRPATVSAANPSFVPAPHPEAQAKLAAGSLRQLQCDALAAQIRAIDQAGSDALSPQERGRFAALRRGYREAQVRKGC